MKEENKEQVFSETSFDVAASDSSVVESLPFETRSIFKIRHGSSIPTSQQLEPFELGYLINKGMYINQDGEIKKLFLEKITLTGNIGTNWIGSSAPYTQDINFKNASGFPFLLSEKDQIHIKIDFSKISSSSIKDVKKAYNMIDDSEINSNGSLKFKCYLKKPTISIPIIAEVLR